jgi:hypothetical protein
MQRSGIPGLLIGASRVSTFGVPWQATIQKMATFTFPPEPNTIVGCGCVEQ